MGAFDLLAGLTARLASTARLDEIVDAVVPEIVALGFDAVWLAVLDEQTGILSTLKEVIDGVDVTHEMPKISIHDLRHPIGQGFQERKMINIADPDALHILEHDDDVSPPGRMALLRGNYNHLRGHPFACGPLFGSRGRPVGALGLSSYRGREPIPDDVLSTGLLRAFRDHLGIAIERAVNVEQLSDSLHRAQTTIINDARIKAVGELAAAVAHDLNNLCGIALLALGVAKRSPADAFEALPRIERANRAIGDLVMRLQRIARPTSTEPERANLQEIVEDILFLVKPKLREQSIEVDVLLPPVPAVRCDRVLVHQVVLNLVINATEALAEVPPERRRIRIVLRDDTGVVRLTVADTGPGIAPAVLAQLFQPFITTKRDAHLGLGLAAARASLQHVDGVLEGRNAPTGGAVFEVTLVVAPPGATAEVASAAPAVLPEATRGARILTIDDDIDMIEIIRVTLELEGYVVSTATGSAQGIAMASVEPFDLVLCDIGMPKQNGIDVCRSLRGGGYLGKLVLMTGYDHYAFSDEQRVPECDALLKKPFVGGELIRLIESLLGSAVPGRA